MLEESIKVKIHISVISGAKTLPPLQERLRSHLKKQQSRKSGKGEACKEQL